MLTARKFAKSTWVMSEMFDANRRLPRVTKTLRSSRSLVFKDCENTHVMATTRKRKTILFMGMFCRRKENLTLKNQGLKPFFWCRERREMRERGFGSAKASRGCVAQALLPVPKHPSQGTGHRQTCGCNKSLRKLARQHAQRLLQRRFIFNVRRGLRAVDLAHQSGEDFAGTGSDKNPGPSRSCRL